MFQSLNVEAVVAQWRMTVNATFVGSLPTQRSELLFMNIFGVELRHSMRNASKNSAESR